MRADTNTPSSSGGPLVAALTLFRGKIMSVSFWDAVQKVVDHYLPDEVADWEVTGGEEGDGHVVHLLKELRAGLEAHQQRQGAASTS